MTDFSDIIRSRIRPFGAPKPAPVTGDYLCRCCLTPLEAKYQPGWAARPGHVIVTCRQPVCRLGGFTFTVDDYDTLDLRKYRAKEHADYRSHHAALPQGQPADTAAD